MYCRVGSGQESSRYDFEPGEMKKIAVRWSLDGVKDSVSNGPQEVMSNHTDNFVVFYQWVTPIVSLNKTLLSLPRLDLYETN